MKKFLKNLGSKIFICEKKKEEALAGRGILPGFFCRKVLRKNKAVVFVEYVALVIFLLAAFYVMEGYIIRGILGKWKEAGDTFGHGRQYDPRLFSDGGTIECLYFYNVFGTTVNGFWMDKRYYEANCNCFLPPSHIDYDAECTQCRKAAARTTDGMACNATP